jgi:2-desacetyl-2-hydroxyethyl bacteriochlorophyllide A dehydrogenase
MNPRLRTFLNRQATVRLGQIGHSDVMVIEAKREAFWWLQARLQAGKRRRGVLRGRAVVWPLAGRAELVAVEVPKPGHGEVTVAIETSVVSPGTERAQFLGLPNAKVDFPFQPGYTAAGVVVATGRGVAGLENGDVVGVRNVFHASVVTASVEGVHRLPPGLSPAEGAFVQLGVICGHGVRRAEIQPGEPFCVIGAGLIGALTQRLASSSGAGPATIVARSNARRDLAAAGGAAFLATESDAPAIQALAAPLVIEATGDPAAIALAVELAAEGARIVLLGSSRGVSTAVPLDEIRRKRLRVVGAHVSTLAREAADAPAHEAERFIELVGSGRVGVADLTPEVVDPREADFFYRRLARSPDMIGARFDWTALPAEERLASGQLMRLPDLSGRGVDDGRRPLPPGGRRRRTPALLELTDPFEDVTGRLRIGLLGCGDITPLNAAAIGSAPNAEVTACFDPIRRLAEDVALQHGAVVTGSAAELLARSDVDAVLLAVPHHLHAPLGVDAAAAGKHVVVEKPLANDLRSALDLAAAATRANVELSVCFPQRYEPSVVLARRLIEAGALGELSGTLLNFLLDKSASYWVGGYSGRAPSDWRASRERSGGGILIMNLSHYVDVLRRLGGVEASLVSAHTHAIDRTAEVEDSVAISVRYENGGTGSLFGSGALRGSFGMTELRLWGPEGQVVVEPTPRVYTLRAQDGLLTGRWQSLGNLPPVNTRAVYFSRLADAITRGRRPDITGDDGLAVQAFIEAAYRSSELGTAVSPTALLEEVPV